MSLAACSIIQLKNVRVICHSVMVGKCMGMENMLKIPGLCSIVLLTEKKQARNKAWIAVF